MKLGMFCFIFLCVVVLLAFAYAIMLGRPTLMSSLAARMTTARAQVKDRVLSGWGVHNIPGIKLVTNAPEDGTLRVANKCQFEPLHVSDWLDAKFVDEDCQRTCLDPNASVLRVDRANTQIAFGSKLLTPGIYCSMGPKPECNPLTTNILLTLNSVMCIPKFPRLFGGSRGTTIVACNNYLLQQPDNVLWDNKYNRAATPWNVHPIQSEDELLPNGLFRFVCHFEGRDERGNKCEAHPFDRLHPIKNYCAQYLRNAHPNVRTIYNSSITTRREHGELTVNNESLTSGGFECDCGDSSITRAKHLEPGNKRSLCSPEASVKSTSTTEDQKTTVTLPYPCFTLHSPAQDVGSMFPCPQHLMLSKGVELHQIQFAYTKNPFALIESPIYNKFPPLPHYRQADVLTINPKPLFVAQNLYISSED